MAILHPERVASSLRLLLLGAVCIGLLGIVPGCGGGGSSGGSGTTPGINAGNSRLLSVGYGRLVDVFGFVTDANGQTVQLFLNDVVIGSDIIDQRVSGSNVSDAEIQYDFLNSNPDTLQPRLLITREIGSKDFDAAFDGLSAGLRQINGAIFGQDQNQNNPFTVVPRNASLKLLFSSSLDVDDDFFYSRDPATGRISGIKNTEAVQLLEIVGDPTDGDDIGDFRVIPTRVVVRGNEIVIDPVLLGTEGVQLQVKNNAAGLPASPDQLGANIRIAMALEGPLSIAELDSPSGSVFVGTNNSAIRSIVRDFRSGNSVDETPDLSGGFVRDSTRPRIIGELLMFLERVDDVSAATQRITLYKNEQDHEIDVGDVIRIIDPASGEVFGVTEVVQDPADDRGNPGAQHVRVEVRRLLGLEGIDPANVPGFPIDLTEREGWLRLNAPRSVLIAEFRASRRDPVSGDVVFDNPANFITFTPDPLPLSDGTPSPNNQNISPFAGAIIRFSKPIDMSTMRAFDSFFLATRNVLDDEVILGEFVVDEVRNLDPARFFPDYKDKFITPHLVAGRIQDEDGSQTSLRLQPTLGMYLDAEMRSIDEGELFARKRFKYFLHVLGGQGGIKDLAGNALDFQSEVEVVDFLSIPFSLDTRSMVSDPAVPMFEDNLPVSIVRRFADRDEDEQPSVYMTGEMPLVTRDNETNAPNMLARVDDVFGEATFLSEGRLQARGTSRFTKVVDNLNQQAPPAQGGALSWCPPLVSNLFNSALFTVSSTALSVSVAGGIQNPFNPFGARVQTVWREVDFNLSRIDPADFNLDVEQMYWAPFSQDPVSFDEFDRISLFLGHSEFRPEVCLGAGDVLPFFWDSGLRVFFKDNFAFNKQANNQNFKDNPPAPHPAYVDENMVIDTARAITEPNGVNRYLPLPDFLEPFFVWRDETSTVQGGEAGRVNTMFPGSVVSLSSDAYFQRYTPFHVSPFLGGSGRLNTLDGIGEVFRMTGYFSNASGASLRGDTGSPPTIGGSLSSEKFTGGTLPSIALPLLADFQTLPDDPDLPLSGGFRATGFNGWQISVPVQSSPYPFFRAYSGGFAGVDAIPPVIMDPDNVGWRRTTGGFMPNGEPSTIPIGIGGINVGALLDGQDNTVYWVMADFLKRQSVVTAGFVEILNPHRMPPRINGDGDPRLGPYFSASNGSFALPEGFLPTFDWLSEPAVDQLPAGTSVVPEFRAASRLEDDDASNTGIGRGLPEGFWRWGFHDPEILPGSPRAFRIPFPPFGTPANTPFTERLFVNAERPDELNFPLNPLTAGDAGLRKWDERELPGSGLRRNYWAYFYNRQVTDYTTSIANLTDEIYLRDFVGDNETFRPGDVKYFNWRFIMRNNVEASPPVSPTLESFAVTYRFEKR